MQEATPHADYQRIERVLSDRSDRIRAYRDWLEERIETANRKSEIVPEHVRG